MKVLKMIEEIIVDGWKINIDSRYDLDTYKIVSVFAKLDKNYILIPTEKYTQSDWDYFHDLICISRL